MLSWLSTYNYTLMSMSKEPLFKILITLKTNTLTLNVLFIDHKDYGHTTNYEHTIPLLIHVDQFGSASMCSRLV